MKKSDEQLQQEVAEIRRFVDGERWIPADERTPETSDTYIVCCKEQDLKHVTFAKFYKKLGYWELKGSRTFWKDTHWMPLPDAPTNTPTDTSTKQLYKELDYCDSTRLPCIHGWQSRMEPVIS